MCELVFHSQRMHITAVAYHQQRECCEHGIPETAL